MLTWCVFGWVQYLEQQVDAFRELLRAREKMVKVRPITHLPPSGRSLIHLPTTLGTSLVDSHIGGVALCRPSGGPAG